jgi:isopentenyl phosphate kinase
VGLWIVKLGGSLITDKERPSTVRHQVVTRLAREIAAARRGRDQPLIVSHGSGSFGHAAAAKHELHRGVTDPGQVPGVAVT